MSFILLGILNSQASVSAGPGGYFGGGYGGGRITAVDKFASPSDSRTTLGTGLSSGVYILGAMANSGVAGYFGGGFPATATVDKFAFPSDSRTTLGTGLSVARSGLAGMADNEV